MKSISLDIKGIAPYVSKEEQELLEQKAYDCLLYTSPSPRDCS